MVFIRPIAVLLIFFALLFTFKGPVLNTGNRLNVSVIDPAKEFFQKISGYATSTNFHGSSTVSTSSSISNIKATSTTRVSVDKLPPVKSSAASYADSALTVQGIIDKTNNERKKKGIETLFHNVTLDKSATAKLEDMFSRQYFEHVSPSGTSVSDLVTKAGYSYIVVGENLALGNFGGDAQVVLAWMNSPGHRANILDTRYQEIGIAVGRGMYEGRMQWLAVQHFGKPLAACPAVDQQLKSSIDSTQLDLHSREVALIELKKTIDSSNPGDPSYESNIQRYNELAQEYNRRLESFRTAVGQYNQSVQEFNKCAGLSN